MKNILVLAGASGVGKTSVAMKILSSSDKYRLIRSVTTRKPRGDGHDGEYIYLSEKDFEERISSGELLEYMNYGGSFYGTPISEINSAFAEGKVPLLILDLTGVQTIREKNLDFSVFVFYIYEELSVIEKRLYERECGKGSDKSEEVIKKRMSANIRDYLMLPEISGKFDAFVKNEIIDDTARRVQELHERLLKAKLDLREENKRIVDALSASASKNS